MGHTEHALVAKLVSCARVIQDTQDFSVGTVSTLCQLNSVYQHTWWDVFDVLLDWIKQWHESNRVKGCELGELFLQSTENCLFFFFSKLWTDSDSLRTYEGRRRNKNERKFSVNSCWRSLEDLHKNNQLYMQLYLKHPWYPILCTGEMKKKITFRITLFTTAVLIEDTLQQC